MVRFRLNRIVRPAGAGISSTRRMWQVTMAEIGVSPADRFKHQLPDGWHIRELVALRATQELTDRQLLECFLASRDERTFADLVRRHGRLVLAVCRRVLRHQQDT